VELWQKKKKKKKTVTRKILFLPNNLPVSALHVTGPCTVELKRHAFSVVLLSSPHGFAFSSSHRDTHTGRNPLNE